MNPVLFSAYALSDIIMGEYDEFYDEIITNVLEGKTGMCEYLIINLKLIIGLLDDARKMDDISFDVEKTIDNINDFLKENNLKAEDTLVFVQ
jgi:hypothetical protein